MADNDLALEPIVLTLDLDVTPAEAYERFTADFGRWWPTLTHSLSRDAATRCALEPRLGGRVFETAPDGAEHLWGTVTDVEPGRSVAFTWHPGRDAASAQQVALRFERAGTCTRVTLTHGGWEALGEIAPILRREYLPGWQHVFAELFGRYAGRRH
ncbi:MAG: hypothetical protein H6R27_1883 [Proteobacteria bacterium]|nr:hypothetical protein [Pseudomonadota bacterium]